MHHKLLSLTVSTTRDTSMEGHRRSHHHRRHILFATGLMGVGVLSFGFGDFALTWQPVPEWVIWHARFAVCLGWSPVCNWACIAYAALGSLRCSHHDCISGFVWLCCISPECCSGLWTWEDGSDFVKTSHLYAEVG